MLDDSFPSVTIGYLILDDSLPSPYYRLITVIWLPFLKIEKFRDTPTWKYINVEDLPNYILWFLIDMKFKSKFLQMFVWTMYTLRNIYSDIFSKKKCNSGKLKTIKTKQNFQKWWVRLSKKHVSNFQILRYENNMF